MSFGEFICNGEAEAVRELKLGTCRPNWNECATHKVLLRVELDDPD